MSNNNIIFAILHLKEASQLLKYAIPEVSDTLLLLSKSIIDNENILQSDIDSISALSDEITSDDKNEISSSLIDNTNLESND